jgi:hypothetical protein
MRSRRSKTNSQQPLLHLRRARPWLGRLKLSNHSPANTVGSDLETLIARYRDAAQRLVRSSWGQARICLLADALLRHGSLSGDQIFELAA